MRLRRDCALAQGHHRFPPGLRGLKARGPRSFVFQGHRHHRQRSGHDFGLAANTHCQDDDEQGDAGRCAAPNLQLPSPWDRVSANGGGGGVPLDSAPNQGRFHLRPAQLALWAPWVFGQTSLCKREWAVVADGRLLPKASRGAERTLRRSGANGLVIVNGAAVLVGQRRGFIRLDVKEGIGSESGWA